MKPAPQGRALAVLALGALGVVYGDIGTSPLYALKECFNGPHGLALTQANVLGILSLIFWSLNFVVTFKYLSVVMRADNRGEGGILALLALARPSGGATGLKRLLMLVVAVGGFGSVGALAIGPFVLEKVYDAELSGVTLALLAAGSGCYMLALALSQAIIALKGHSLVARGWVCGAIALALGTWFSSDDVFRRVEIGVLVSSIAAMAFFAVALRYRLASGARPDQESVIEAFTDSPVEP